MARTWAADLAKRLVACPTLLDRRVGRGLGGVEHVPDVRVRKREPNGLRRGIGRALRFGTRPVGHDEKRSQQRLVEQWRIFAPLALDHASPRSAGFALPGRAPWVTLAFVRRLSLASLLTILALSACQGDEPGGIEASVSQAQIQVDPAVPDTNATLTLLVDLEAKGQPEEVTLGSLTITQQPVTDDSDSLTFEAHMVNTMGDDSVVRLDPNDAATVRVLNDGTTNGDLASWCRLPVQLEVVVETADGEDASATADVMISCP